MQKYRQLILSNKGITKIDTTDYLPLLKQNDRTALAQLHVHHGNKNYSISKMPTTKLLLTVTTYPLPSRSYDELVCTAA
jgi:hypothetical protein